MITLISPADKSEFSTLSGAQKEFFRQYSQMDLSDPTITKDHPYPWMNQSILDDDDASKPASIVVKWKNSLPHARTFFHLSIDPEFSVTEHIATISRIHYSAEDDYYFVILNNLFSGTTYYWKVSCGDAISETRSFSTVYGELRTIRADGVGNVRDFGGRVNKYGKRIRQGLIFRGAALNELEKPSTASLNGLGVMRDDLKIKTDLDLRFEAVGKYEYCQLGDHINYRLFTANAYDGVINDADQGELYKNIFEVIADADNYPIYIHCVAGADRTGTVGYILDAILGMSDEDIIANYNITGLTGNNLWSIQGAPVVKILDERYPGLCLGDQLIQMAYSFGFTKEMMDQIRANLLED